ncbi:MAG: S9 family peptidase [Bacteroidota bacterium]|nr:S9 family peptidase [Bacteroidota bacterium]
MRYILSSLLCLFLWSNSVFSQSERVFTMDEAISMVDNQTKQSLRPKSIPMIQWLPYGNFYSYFKPGAQPRLCIVDAENKTIDSSLILSILDAAIKEYDSKMALKSFPMIEWIDNNSFKIISDGQFLAFSISEKSFSKILSFPKTAEHTEYDKNLRQLAFVENNNISIANSDGIIKITNDGGKGIVYGETVHRSEFGITKGLFWSPRGNKLAFYRMDETMVTDYAIYDNSTMPATVKNIKYPVAGAPSHHVTVGIYDINTKKTIYLETGLPQEQYLTNISWNPDESSIYIAHVNRGQNQMLLNVYSAETGFLEKNVFEERDEKYIEPQHGLVFMPNESNKFIWQSEKDGFNHLYLYSTNGRLIKQLTKGKWIVTSLIGIEPSGNMVYFEATKESPTERNIYSVNVNTLEIKKLSLEQGTHYALFNANYSYYLDIFSSMNVPRRISLHNNKGDMIETLLKSPNPIADFKLGETTLFPIINDGVVLHCRMITPPDFDPKRKYPVVVYVYGGPHAQMVNNTWLGGSNLWMQLMAQRGYIVFTMDNRGSANRGHEFESATFRDLGTVETSDQMAGINYLKKLGYVDPARIAVHGWSFGGFMTTTLLSRHPGVFKLGIAGGPVIDWALYEIMYTERYMDSPQENPEGYKKSNLINQINNLQDDLLMIHGCDDDVVLWQHSLMYCKAAVDTGNTYLDYFVYPGHKHNVLGKDRIHLMQKITEYIMEKL